MLGTKSLDFELYRKSKDFWKSRRENTKSHVFWQYYAKKTFKWSTADAQVYRYKEEE